MFTLLFLKLNLDKQFFPSHLLLNLKSKVKPLGFFFGFFVWFFFCFVFVFFLLWIVVDTAGADRLMCLEFKQGEGGVLFFLNKE